MDKATNVNPAGEDQLPQELTEFHTLADAAPVLIWRAAVDKNRTHFNKQWLLFTGRRLEQELGQGWAEGIHPDDRKNCLRTYFDEFEKRQPFELVYRLRRFDGVYRWIVGRATPFFGSEGEFRGYLGCCYDDTERIEAIAEHRKNDALFQAMAQSAHIGPWELDLRNSHVYFSDEVCRIHELPLGYSPTLDEALTFYPPRARDIVTKNVSKSLESGEPYVFTLPFITAKGNHRWVRSYGTPEIQDGVCVRLYGSFQDVTAEYQAAEKERELERQLRQAQKMESLGTLTAGIAHDFNNILGIIIGNLDVLQLTHDQEDDKFQFRVAAAQKACERARDLVKKLLTFSADSGGSPKLVDLAGITVETVELFRTAVPSSISLQSEISPGSYFCLIDPPQIHQVILNLCTNAAQAMAERCGTITVSLASRQLDTEEAATSGLTPGRHAVISVKDNGPGIPIEIQNRIFDPFFTTKTVGSGSGLGLSVVHGIVRQHGGAIAVTSTPGEGAHFSVYLPLNSTQSLPVLNSGEHPIARGQGERLLVVDDEKPLAIAIADTLTALGYAVHVCFSAQVALEHLQQEKDYKLILSDLSMPDINGWQFLERALALLPEVSCLIMSGYKDVYPNAENPILRSVKVLEKPVKIQDLAREIGRAVRPGSPSGSFPSPA